MRQPIRRLLSVVMALLCFNAAPARSAAVLQAMAPLTVAMEPAAGFITPPATLAGSYSGPCTVHPCVLTNAAAAAAFVTEAQATTSGVNSGRSAALALLAANATQILASSNASVLTTYETPITGVNMATYMSAFSVWSSPTAGNGAAWCALYLAEYWYMYQASGGAWGNQALATSAKAAADAILVNWAHGGFLVSAGGAQINDYEQFTQPNVSNSTTWQSEPLQIGRGMAAYVIAADLLNDGTSPDQIAVDNFIIRIKNILVPAYNFNFVNNNSYRENRYTNQPTNAFTTFLYMARYLGDANFMRELAGDTTVPKTLIATWPQQLEGQMWGYGENGVKGPPASANGLFYLPIATIGEFMDRIRAPTHDDWGYPAGALTNLMLCAIVLAEAGYQPYAFVGPKGQSLQAALDFYGAYVAQYMSLTDQFTIPDDGVQLPDKQQYIGTEFGDNAQSCTTNASTGVQTCVSATGNTVMQGYGYPFELAVQVPAYANDNILTSVMAQFGTVGTASYVPFRNIDPFSLLGWR